MDPDTLRSRTEHTLAIFIRINIKGTKNEYRCVETHEKKRKRIASLNQNNNLGVAMGEQDHGDGDEQMQLEGVDVARVARGGLGDCRERLFLPASFVHVEAPAVAEP